MFLVFVIAFFGGLTLANAEQSIECTRNVVNTNKVISCQIYENDTSIKTFVVKINYNQDMTNFETMWSVGEGGLIQSSTNDESTNETTMNIAFSGNRNASTPIININIAFNNQLDIIKGISYAVTSVGEGTAYTVTHDVVSRTVADSLLLTNANVYIESAETIASFDANMGTYAEFNFGALKNNSGIQLATLKGVIESNTPIAEIYTNANNAYFEGANDSVITFNKTTGEFQITFDSNQFDIEKNLARGLIQVKFDLTNVPKNKSITAITSIKNLKYTVVGSTTEQPIEGKVYAITNLVPKPNGSIGDWNDDGEMGLVDLVRYRLYLAPQESVVNEFKAFGINKKNLVDLNNDGSVDLSDVVQMRKIIAGGSI